ncbi:xanthine dehydrogenase subunit XdhB [Lacrimispora sp. 210928-DFI.3.58]|uniref:xanthine dehydrogenase subunit XdhB n=1 Tax=Lacrimispora sp. 210928-DFI.3.58 TaxID=2883214 RepID=UPI001D09616C|nr:xanthine dehydrogenase subunit XdhB [Lacrimispora sp. 210928-DFI.3.58]MCB7317141.1 xanthine dehydrogenase FAD-binding subunit XdhB [Lacrimispora sp. 210928-DFI.3.58]
MYDIERFYQAKNIEDAVQALRADPEAVIISGGSDVLIKIREGKLAGCSLVSIHGIRELEGVSMEEDGTIVIGPATTFSHITNNEIIQKHIPILGNAVDMAGGPQLRNIGTVGGNVCNGVTSADSASSLCCLDAILVLTGPEGVREVPISQWYTGPGRTVRGHEEILTAIKIKRESYEGYSGHYIKYGKRNAMEIATLGCAVTVKLTEDRRYIEDLHLAYGVAAPTPIRCREAEERAKGMEIGEALFEAVGKWALEEVNPRSSWRASKEFRLQLVEELGKRALKQAVINGEGGNAHA